MSVTELPGTPAITSPPTPQPERPFRTPGWSWFQAGPVGWWVRPGWERCLLGPEGLRLDEWRRQGRLTTVKTGPHRIVYRVELDQGAVYIKHYLVPDFRSKVRQWVRRGKGRNEGKRAIALARLGVPTITPIALGEHRQRRFLFENYLITHAIPDTTPLDRFVEQRLPTFPGPRQARIRQRLAEALAVLTARLHEAGYVHGDFHPGNILVRLDGHDQPRLAMIDLDAVRSRRHLNWDAVQANLALLNHYFWLRCGRSDRYRFLRAYLKARRQEPPDLRSFAQGIEDATRVWAERLWTRWGRRCRGTNKYFRSVRARTGWAVAARDLLDEATVRELLADPDAPFDRPDTTILKDSRTTTVAALTLPVAGRPTPVIYKRFNRKKWLDPLFNLFRPSRGWRAWQAAQHLLSRAVPTPRNLAILARTPPTRLLPRETYLITVKAEPAITLHDYVHHVLPTLDDDTRRHQVRRLTVALARLLRTMHERSLSHRDLKAANVLIEGDPSAAEADIRLSLIDLVGVALEHPLSDPTRWQNLARLHLSLSGVEGRTRTDFLRFLRAYLPWGLATGDHWKQVWRAIAARSRVKQQQNQRRGRPLT